MKYQCPVCAVIQNDIRDFDDDTHCYKCPACKSEFLDEPIKKTIMKEFEGDVLKGRYGYEIVDDIGNGLTENYGILKDLENKKVRITIEEIEG